MSTTKTKVIDISTGQAQKNVENLTKSFVPLRQQIKLLKDEIAQLEEGSVEYNRAAKELADLQQKQIEITETAKAKISPTPRKTDGSIFPVGGNMKLATNSVVLIARHTQKAILLGFVK